MFMPSAGPGGERKKHSPSPSRLAFTWSVSHMSVAHPPAMAITGQPKRLNKIWAFPKETYTSIEHAIKVIEAAKDHPELLSAGPTPTSAKDPRK